MARQRRLDRSDLLAKAITVIRRNGYRETSLDDLAREFNFTKPALYYYVASKEALLYEIYEKTIEDWLVVIKKIADDDRLSPGERIHEIIRRFMHLCTEHDQMALFFNEKAYLSDDHFRSISEKERQVVDIIAGVIEKGVDEGSMRPVRAKEAAYGLIGMTAWSYRWVNPDGPRSIDELADAYYELLSRGWNVIN